MWILWGARFFSFLAESLTESLIAILVWKYTESPIFAAMVISSGRLALWVFGMHAGKIASTPKKDGIAKASSFFCMIVLAGYASIAAYSAISAWLLFATNFLCMTAKTYEHAAINALITSIKTDRNYLRSKVAIDSTKRWARFSSPILFILMLSYDVDASAISYIAILYFLSFILYMFCRFPEQNRSAENQQPASYSSIVPVARSQPLMFLFTIFMLYNFAYFSINGIFLPKLFESSGSSLEYGYALLSGSFGGVVGNKMYKNINVHGIANKLVIAFLLVSCSSFIFSQFEDLSIILLGCFIGGLALPVMDMGILEAIRKYLDPDKHGLGFSLFRFMADAGLIIGSYLGGIALKSLSLSYSFISAALWIIVICMGSLAVRRFIPILK